MKSVFEFSIKYFKRLDKTLLLLCLMASASSVFLLYTMYYNGVNPAVVSSRNWIMQLLSSGVGVIFALVLAGINYRFLSKIWFIPAALGLTLSLLLFTSLGVRTPGAPDLNWLDLGFIEIQPSAFLRVAFVLTFATHINKVSDRLNEIKHMSLLCLHGAIPAGLVFIQEDQGTTVILIGIFLIMLFAAGLSWKYIAAGIVATPVILYFLWNVVAQQHHKDRILVLFDREMQESEMLGTFYQQWGGLRALSSGGLTGKGFFGGEEAEYVHVYAIHNDFMFAYVGMVAGFVGCILAVLLLMSICFRTIIASGTSKDFLGRMLCLGVFAIIFFESAVNIGMVLAITPVAGSQLPFISAGGSTSLALWLAIGLVLSVRFHRRREHHMFYEDD
ncbi:MAG: FtsW/RodA/SpoVE family cell cycle protein [Oscillospiraceae bacterium]|nr:FtsW/RodA/SpoVE family cell cycle protein [Oscillospiraceae bacterium]